MKNKSLLKISLIAILGLGTVSSCVQDDKFDIPEILCDNQFSSPNTTIAEIKALAPAATVDNNYVSNYEIVDDLIFEGYVVSSDEAGNFYKSLSIQDLPENPTAGIQIAINKSFLYADYPVGAKVRVKAKGLSVGIDRGVVKLGLTTPAGQIPGTQMKNYISGVCNGNQMEVATIVPVEVSSIAEATQDKYLNTLVTIDNVQFSDADGTLTYADAVQMLTMDRTIEDKGANSAILRNSGFANFAAQVMPTGSGNLTTVISKYTSGSNVTWQLYIRDLKDVDFSFDRFVINGLENFQEFDVNTSSFPNYSNVGNRTWRVREYSRNKYIEVTGFGAGTNEVKSQLAIPFLFSGTNTLSFKTNAGYYNGDVLKIYWSPNYDATNPSSATLYDITDLFDISKGRQPATGTGSNFEPSFRGSGIKSFATQPAGSGHIIFEYYKPAGVETNTTTMQIDDIIIL